MVELGVRPDSFRIGIYGVWLVDQRVLMTRSRTKTGLILNFPGGALEAGEAPCEALVREFREETGLVVSVGRLLYASLFYHPNTYYPDQHQYHTYYLIESAEGELLRAGNGVDVELLEWFDPGKLPLGEMLPPDREFVERLPSLLTSD